MTTEQALQNLYAAARQAPLKADDHELIRKCAEVLVEFAEVSPSSVVGEKDAVDSDGKPVYQGMQASSAEVIANMVAELQSLRLRNASLEARVTTLESK